MVWTHSRPASSSGSLSGYGWWGTAPHVHQSSEGTGEAGPRRTLSSKTRTRRKTGRSRGSWVYCQKKTPTIREKDRRTQRGEITCLLPGSPPKQSGVSLKDKAEFVTLTISYDDILHVLHDRASTPAHQAQGSVVIGLCEVVLLWKPVNKYNKTVYDTPLF